MKTKLRRRFALNLAGAVTAASFLSFASPVAAQGPPAPAPTNSSLAKPAPPPAPTIAVPADVQKAMAMPEGADRHAAFVAAVKAWAQTNPIDAINWAAQIQDKAQQRLGLESATSVWIAKDEKAATDWAMNHGSGIQQHFTFGAYGTKNRQAGADWVVQQPKHTAGELGVTVEAWCGHPFNPKAVEAASAWVLQQKLSKEDFVAAVHFVAAAKAWTNPPDGAAWVASLPANLPREDAAQIVANIWSRKTPADIPKLKEWINSLQLPDDQKAKITTAIVVK